MTYVKRVFSAGGEGESGGPISRTQDALLSHKGGKSKMHFLGGQTESLTEVK